MSRCMVRVANLQNKTDPHSFQSQNVVSNENLSKKVPRNVHDKLEAVLSC